MAGLFLWELAPDAGARAVAWMYRYWCPEASVSPVQRLCGGDGFYCPRGSGRPLLASNGYYTVGGANATVRTAQRSCEVCGKGGATVG